MGTNTRKPETIKMVKRVWTWFLPVMGLLLFLSAGSSFAAQQDPKQDPQEVLARWGKKVITRQDLMTRIASLPVEYQMRIQSEEQLREFLENVVQIEIIGAEAKAQKLDRDKTALTRIKDATNSILAQEYMKKKLADVKKPTEKEVEQYYNGHKGEYLNPAQVKAQHILVRLETEAKPEEIAAAKTKAENIHKELLAGGDFAKLAEKYSDDTGSKANGGDLGFFTKDKMIPEFSEAAFKLKKDEISAPVKTGYGFHIIKVNDISPEKQMDLKEAAPGIESSLENAKREALVEKELERLKKKYSVMFSEPSKKKQ